MRLVAIALTSLSSLSILSACADTDTDDPAVAAYTAAYSASEAEGDGQALGTLAFPRLQALAASAPQSAEEAVARVKSYIADHLGCADATASGDGLAITFSKECAWSGRRWTGTITATWAADGGSAELDFAGVTVNGGTLEGSMTVTRLAEGHVTVEADWTRVGPNHEVTGAWDGDYAWTDTTYTINSATHVVSVDGHTATRTSTDVVWQREDPSPEAGTVVMSGFRGRTWTLTFGRDEAGELIITVANAAGKTRVFTPGA